MLIHVYHAADTRKQLLKEISMKLPKLLEAAGFRMGMYDVHTFPRNYEVGDHSSPGVDVSILIWADIPEGLNDEEVTSRVYKVLNGAVPLPVYGKIKLIASKVVEPRSFVADVG